MTLHLFEGFGVEIEHMIVSARDLTVLPVSDRLLTAAAGELVNEVALGELAWSNELPLHVIEFKTNGPARDLAALPAFFQRDMGRANALLEPLGGRLMPTAMHPWMDPDTELRLWPHDHSVVYETFHRIFDCRGHGWSNLQSTHLNLPFGDDQEFGRLHAAIRLLLPLLPALAASSPIVEGRPTGRLDQRMEVYRGNARRVPSVSGLVVPEPVFTRERYEGELLGGLYEDLRPLDPEGVLRHEWLNARGAIARFDRSAIEIRVLDCQECPAADLSIVALVVAVLRAIVAERFEPLAAQMARPTEPLHRLLLATIEDAERASVDDAGYAAALGWKDGVPVPAGVLWRHLADTCFPAARRGVFAGPLEVLLGQGPLARRILAALPEQPSRAELARVYGRLCDCLAEGRMFTP